MSTVPTFSLGTSFMGFGATAHEGTICIAGVPFDLGTSNRPGARFGPGAIRQASRMLVDGAHPVHWVEPASANACDIGNFEIALGNIKASLAMIEQQAAAIQHLVALGGDHTITLALLRALAKRLGPIGLVHFDAHVDTWPESFGQSYGHGSPFYHAINENLVDPHRMIQIGIRSPVQREVHDWTVGQGVTIIDARAFHAQGVAAAVSQTRAVIGHGPAYLSFDIDCLDPAFAPGTGTPEIGGLASWQAQAILQEFRDIHFVGMDVVEVAPAYDTAEITSLAAASMVWEYLALALTRG